MDVINEAEIKDEGENYILDHEEFYMVCQLATYFMSKDKEGKAKSDGYWYNSIYRFINKINSATRYTVKPCTIEYGRSRHCETAQDYEDELEEIKNGLN